MRRGSDSSTIDLKKYQFSLRAFFIAVAVVAVLVSIIGYWVARSTARAELSAFAVEPLWYSGRPLGPSRQFGIRIAGAHIDDKSLARIAQLIPTSGYKVEVVVLDSADITSKGLRTLRSLHGIERVAVFDCPKVDGDEARKILVGYEVEVGSLRE